jgi:GH15 family glucan-1,4-alpha-glucosidase
MSTPADTRDEDGFAEIGGYAVLGDGRGAALVAADGTVDWWAVPRLDSPPPFAALLDPQHGGRMELRPADDTATCERRYLPDTNVLETTYTTESGSVRVTDALNSGNAGELPWSELARRIEGVVGSVEMTLRIGPGDGLLSWEPWVEDDPRGPILHAGSVTMGLRCSDSVEVRVGAEQIDGTVTVGAREKVIIALVATDDEPLFLVDLHSIERRLELTIAAWRRWASQISWDGPDRDRVVRSALALKLLMISQTGAVAAAATTSLPERVGGSKNWDYRFCWIRDAALTIDALSICGQQEEVHAAITWLLRAIHRNGPEIHVLYDLDGHVPTTSTTPAVPGYKHSRPVMRGNDASSQVQLGVYGDLFGTVANWVFGGHVLDVRSGRELADLADRCADTWRHDDAGIWELQQNRPYTSSKMNCWRALDAAARLAEAGQLTGTGVRWRGEAAKVRRWVGEHCWSEKRHAYTFFAGSEDLDASVLIGAEFGFDSGPRMSTSIDAISAELGAGPLLFRYSGMQREEQTFLACAFWRVSALVCVGRADEARRMMDALTVTASPLGLMSEMAAPGSYELLGNVPQALSHLTHIKALALLRDAERS